MPVIIASDQLVGKFQVTQNTKAVTTIEEYIDSIEKSTIIEMLGATLGNAFWDDLDVNGVPQEARFEVLFEPFEIDDGDCIIVSKGMIQILLAFACCAYLRDSDQMNTDTGNQSPKGENSERVSTRNKITKIYNEAVESIHAIQWYIQDNPEDYDYDDYNGQHIGFYMPFG